MFLICLTFYSLPASFVLLCRSCVFCKYIFFLSDGEMKPQEALPHFSHLDPARVYFLLLLVHPLLAMCMITCSCSLPTQCMIHWGANLSNTVLKSVAFRRVTWCTSQRGFERHHFQLPKMKQDSIYTVRKLSLHYSIHASKPRHTSFLSKPNLCLHLCNPPLSGLFQRPNSSVSPIHVERESKMGGCW